MRHVLWVDDQVFKLNRIKDVLRDEFNCVVHYALDLTKALRKLEEREYDMIILEMAFDLGEESLDVHTPEYAGFDVLSRIENTPVVVISAYTNDFKISRDLKKYDSVKVILAKPVTVPNFRDVVREVLGGVASER